MTKDEIDTMVTIHEAGHAVASYFLGVPFVELKFTPGRGPGTWGSMVRDPEPDVSMDTGIPEERQRLERMIVCLLAGPAAEQSYINASPWPGGGSDLPHAIQYACRRYALGNEMELRLGVVLLWQHAKRIVSENLACIQSLALKLKEARTLSWEQCVVHIQGCFANASMTHSEVTAIMDRSDFDRLEHQASLDLT